MQETKMQCITRRENIERKIDELKKELSTIENNCKHDIVIMYRCSNYYWIDAKCLFCGKKIEYGHVLKQKEESVIDADLEYLSSNDDKYKLVKDKYEAILEKYPDWSEQQIVKEINKELRDMG